MELRALNFIPAITDAIEVRSAKKGTFTIEVFYDEKHVPDRKGALSFILYLLAKSKDNTGH